MSTDIYSMYRSGRLAEAVDGLMMPVMCVEERANAVYRCAEDAGSLGEIGERISDEISRLERALATLREVANGRKPALRLVAAE